MEDAEFTGFGDACDQGLVFRDGKSRVAAVGSVDEQLEKLPAERLVRGAHEGPAAFEVGECLELAGAEEFDMPVLHAGTLETGFLIDAEVELDVLCDGSLEVRSVTASLARAHPFLDGGGGKMAHAMGDGTF